MATQPQSRLGKYKGLVYSIGVFLALVLGVLGMNFVISGEISDNAVAVNMAGRQRMLSQRMTKALLTIQSSEGVTRETAVSELNLSHRLFSTTLDAFDRGGETDTGGGAMAPIGRMSNEDGRVAVDSAKAIWGPLSPQVAAVAGGELAGLDATAAQMKQHNLTLLKLMNDTTKAAENDATASAERLRWIQIAGILAALAIFAFITLRGFRQLREGDAKAEAAKRETDDILDSVNEGLFLLDRELSVGNQHSASLNKILGSEQVAGRNFIDVLKPLVPAKALEEAKSYMQVLFKEHVNIKLVQSINPLVEVEAFMKKGQEHRYLSFGFKRVSAKDASLSHLLATVTDVTDQIVLSRELERTQKQGEAKVNMVLSILHVEPDLLHDFITRADTSLQEINSTLREHGSKRTGKPELVRDALDKIYPMIHQLKGEAALLQLSYFEEQAHEFETKIASLREQSTVSGDDVLPLTVMLNKIMTNVDSVRDMVNKMAGLREQFESPTNTSAAMPVVTESKPEDVVKTSGDAPEPPAAAAQAPPIPGRAIPVSQLTRLAERIAQAEGKRVAVTTSGLGGLTLTPDRASALRDVLVQLVRNAVVHGIETPQERRAAGKPEVGKLLLQATDSSKGIELVCYDDGRGVSGDNLRDKAIEAGLYTAEELSTWSAEKLRGLLFETGLSTATEVTEAAGRGVGMDVVKMQIEKVGGQLELSTEPGKHCAWRIVLKPEVAIDDLNFAVA